MALPRPSALLQVATQWMRNHPRVRRAAIVTMAIGALGTLGISYEALFRAHLSPPQDRQPTTIYTRPSAWGSDGDQSRPVPIGTLAPELSQYGVPVRLDQVSGRLVQAVLAVEDQRFYRHWGLDLWRIAGAAVANVRSGSISQGGSTITQQLAKNLFLNARRTPLRKLREAAMAMALEDRYDKHTILEAYLNEIYLGQDGARPIRGVGAAARYYFGKDADQLSQGEAALLAGMIRAPNRYRPDRHPDDARARRDLVLRLMTEQGRVAGSVASRAARERVRSRPRTQDQVEAPWFRDFIVQQPGRQTASLPARGTSVYTTLDATLQRAANRAVAEGLKRSPAGAQAALVALDPRTGEILAMVGGRDYQSSQFNRATDAHRQPGSAFKPVVALAALARDGEEEPVFTLASVVRDEPISVMTPAGRWEPANYDRGYRGEVTFREAMEQSLNVPFARIGLAIGPEKIVSAGRALGITSPLRAVPSLALGTSEVTPLELTRAYGALAAGGQLAELQTVLGVVRSGQAAWTAGATSAEPVVDPAVSYLVTSALEGVIARGTGRGLAGLGGWGGLAGKSGTSNDWRDAWFVAYTTSLVVGVWVGYDDGRSLRLTGAAAALPIVSRFLQAAFRIQGPEPFPVPDGVEEAQTGGESSDWWSWGCDGPTEVFLEGTAPDGACRGPGGDWWRRGVEIRISGLRDLLENGREELVRRLVEELEDRARRLRP